MLMKSENSSPAMPAATACGNCGAEERRLIHRVRHRGNFRRLCTTCVLRLHPQAFCPTCFKIHNDSVANDAVRICVKCYSHSHSNCAAVAVAAAPNPYICPLCVRPNSPVFKLKPASVEDGDGGRRVMDRDAARMLLTAAEIAAASMNKAAEAARAEAERRVREAAVTRKRAREALEHVAQLVVGEKARRKEVALRGGVKMAANANSNSNSSSSNVDGDNSDWVLAAMNAVELRENDEKVLLQKVEKQ